MTRLIPLADALGPIRDVYRHLLSAAVSWQADRPRRTDPDLFALICVAADAAPDAPESTAGPRCSPGSDRTVAPTRWTRTGVHRALSCDIPHWCSLHGCPWPVELAEAMWEWFDFLHGTGRLHPGSDPLWELRKPLLCHGGLDQRGRLRADDPARAPSGSRLVECECHLPYRETVRLLNRLVLRCAHRGRTPADVLRALVGEGGRRLLPEELDALLRDLRDDLRDDELADDELRDDLRDAGDGGIPGFPHDTSRDDEPPWL
jgi:hypothetical protein